MEYFKDKVVYQIYPMSFKDTTGNGMGDINGIREKLDYLKKLGVDLLWLTPIYLSPKNDNGYDIKDYYEIDEDFGTMEEFEKLISEANEKDMGLIMDIVANHTSTEHEWFQKALQGDKKYQDFYVFRDKEYMESHPVESAFGGEGWEYVKELDKYYMHNFHKTQADLDWRNEDVRKEVHKVLNFWLNKGVKGFRFDVIDMISKVYEKNQMVNGPHLHDYIKEMTKYTYRGKKVITVGETWSADLDHAKKYSNPDGSEFSMIFGFEHLFYGVDKWSSRIDKFKLKEIFEKWQKGLKNKGWNSLFYSNHDLPRAISRYGDEEYPEITGKQWAIILHMMEGTPYIYQGEEIGMTNRKWEKVEFRDVESINYYEKLTKQYPYEEAMEMLNNISRDNARTPMQWDSSKNSGFTTGNPWIIVNENYKKVNVDKNLKDKRSIFYTYQKLIKLRKELSIINTGEFELIDRDSKQHFSYLREDEAHKLYVFSNLTKEEIKFPLDIEGRVIISNYEIREKYYTLKPYETIVKLLKK